MATLNCDRLHKNRGIVIKSRDFIVTIAILSFLPSAGLADNHISEEQAIHQLTTWIKSNRYYDFPLNCLRAKSLGYKNAGYTIEVVTKGCPGNSRERVVGRWRVDAKTAEIYVQNGTGKYVSPQTENKRISQSAAAKAFSPAPPGWSQGYWDFWAAKARRDAVSQGPSHDELLDSLRRVAGDDAWRQMRAYLRSEDDRLGVKPNRFPKTSEE